MGKLPSSPNSRNTVSPLDLLALARTAAERAAGYLRSVARPSDPAAWTTKGRHDFVTDIDRTAEQIITDVLLRGEPDSRIMGEELSPHTPTDGLVWVVDPLDGTTNFLHDYPAWAVSIAAAVDGVLQAGVVLEVPRDRISYASRGGGAFEGEHRLTVSSISDPTFALIGTGFPFKQLDRLDDYLRQFDTVLRASSGVRRAGSAALDLIDVAAGRFDGFWELSLAPWDIAAGILLIEEAGGRVTDLAGNPVRLAPSGVVAGNPEIHQWLLNIIVGAQAELAQ